MGMADSDVVMLENLVGELAAQLKILSELGHHLVRAHFAFRQRHSDLAEKHEVLVNTLCRTGVVSSEDLFRQAKASRPAKLLSCICSDPRLAGTLIMTTGVPSMRQLLAASPRFAIGLGFALEQFEEATCCFVNLVACCNERVPSTPGMWVGEDLARDGFLALLQETWQCNVLAESISCAMGPSALKQFRTVSRACDECMRSAGRSTRSRPDPAFRGGGGAQQPAVPPKETPAEPPEALRQELALLLQSLWQDVVVAKAFQSFVCDDSVRAFRTISRRAYGCMRSAGQPGSRTDAEEVEGEGTSFSDLCQQSGGQPSKEEEAKRQVSQILVHAPDNFGLFIGSRTWNGSGSSFSSPRRLVRLYDLKTCTNLNGMIGQVIPGVVLRDRWPVMLPSGKTIHVRPKHCQLLGRSPDGGLVPVEPLYSRELKWAPTMVPSGASAEVRALTSRTPARVVVRCLEARCAFNLVMASPAMRNALAVTGKLYVCGGVDQSKVLSALECFDLHTQRWVDPPPASMTKPRGGAAWCISGGHVYCAGGSDWGDGWLNTLERFDPWSGEWRVMPPMKWPRIYAALVSMERRLYICGGHTHNNVPVSSVERFNPANRTWKEQPSMIDARTAPMAFVADGQLFVTGGIDRGYVSSLECYTPRLQAWWRLPPMAYCRAYAGFAKAKGCLYVCGGTGHPREADTGKSERLHSVERFHIGSLRWEELPGLRCPRTSCFLAVRGDILFTCGGCIAGHASAEALDLTSMHGWQIVGPPLMTEWTFGVTAAVAEHIYVLGGRSKRRPQHFPGNGVPEQSSIGLLNSVVRYSMSSNVWDELPSMNYPRTFAGGFHSFI